MWNVLPGHFLSAGFVEYVERVAAQGVVSADQQVRAVYVDVPGVPQGQRLSDELEAGAPLCGEFGLPVSVRAAAAGQEQDCHQKCGCEQTFHGNFLVIRQI